MIDAEDDTWAPIQPKRTLVRVRRVFREPPAFMAKVEDHFERYALPALKKNAQMRGGR